MSHALSPPLFRWCTERLPPFVPPLACVVVTDTPSVASTCTVKRCWWVWPRSRQFTLAGGGRARKVNNQLKDFHQSTALPILHATRDHSGAICFLLCPPWRVWWSQIPLKWRVHVQGYLAHKKPPPPLGPYSSTMPRVLGWP
jgi:hypothetical protein